MSTHGDGMPQRGAVRARGAGAAGAEQDQWRGLRGTRCVGVSYEGTWLVPGPLKAVQGPECSSAGELVRLGSFKETKVCANAEGSSAMAYVELPRYTSEWSGGETQSVVWTAGGVRWVSRL